MIKEFIKYVVPYIKGFIIIDITTKFQTSIKDLVCNKLNLKDLGKVKDRYEGADFLHRFMMKSCVLIALEKEYKIKLFNENEIGRNFLSTEITYDLDGESILVIFCKYGNLPKINLDKHRNFDKIEYAFVLDNYRKVYLCGKISYNSAIKYLIKGRDSQTQDNLKNMLFIGFNHLKQAE